MVARLGRPKKDAAALMEVSNDTIERRLKEKYGLTYSEYKEEKMSYIRLSILQKQYELAMKGDKDMLKWLGKQLCGQTDRKEFGFDNNSDYDDRNVTIEFVKPDHVKEKEEGGDE